MRYSVRWILALALAAAMPGCGGSGGSASDSSKGRPPGPAAGSPDPLFGLTGAVVRNPSGSIDGPVAIAADAEAIYVAGNVGYDQADLFGQVEKRSISSGALVPGFGAAGVVTINPSPAGDPIHAIGLDADHLYVLSTDLSLGGIDAQWRVEKRSKSDGSPDPGFGNGGVLLINPTIGWDVPSHLLIHNDTFYVAGSVMSDKAVWIEKRNLVDGSPDPSFIPNYLLNLRPDAERVAALTVHATGLYVAVVPASFVDGDWMIFRLYPETGYFDAGFNPGGGFLTVNPSAGVDYLVAMEVRDGKLYLAGQDRPGGNGRWHVQRRDLATLQLDGTFGAGGIVTVDPTPDSDLLMSINFDGDSFYLTGHDPSLPQGGWRMERRAVADGALVPAFGAGGVATSDPSPREDYPYAACIADGALFVVGNDGDTSNSQWRIERRSLTTGALSLGFGTPGTLLVNAAPNQFDSANAVVLDGSHLYVAAADYIPGSIDSRWRIEKRHASSGRLDGSFADMGTVYVNPSPGYDEPIALAVADGWLFIGGLDSVLGQQSWRIEKRSTVDGSLDPGFAQGGVFTWTPLGSNDRLRAMIVVGGFIFAAGDRTLDLNNFGDVGWDLLKLRCFDGQPAWGADGHVFHSGGPNWDVPLALASDGASLYIAGAGSSFNPNLRWRIEKRSLDTGAFEAGFGTGGFIETDLCPTLEFAGALAVADGALYVGGTVEGTMWRLEKRKATTGALVGSFGTGGVVQLPPEGGEIRSLAVDGTSLYVAGNLGLGCRVEKRDTAKGKLLAGFGAGGVVTLPAVTLVALALDPGALYLGGMTGGPSGNDSMFLHKMSR